MLLPLSIWMVRPVVNIASETIAGTDPDANGRHTITNDNNLLDITNEAGFGTEMAAPLITAMIFREQSLVLSPLASEDTADGSTGSVVIGGADQSDYVVFEIQSDAGANILADDHATVAAAIRYRCNCNVNYYLRRVRDGN